MKLMNSFSRFTSLVWTSVNLAASILKDIAEEKKAKRPYAILSTIRKFTHGQHISPFLQRVSSTHQSQAPLTFNLCII